MKIRIDPDTGLPIAPTHYVMYLYLPGKKKSWLPWHNNQPDEKWYITGFIGGSDLPDLSQERHKAKVYTPQEMGEVHAKFTSTLQKTTTDMDGNTHKQGSNPLTDAITAKEMRKLNPGGSGGLLLFSEPAEMDLVHVPEIWIPGRK